MWRQGDVLIERVTEIPLHATRLKRPVLAAGDATGHRHSIRDPKSAELYFARDVFVNVTADQATVVHPEHAAIVLTRGTYRVWKQREFDDAAPRPVRD